MRKGAYLTSGHLAVCFVGALSASCAHAASAPARMYTVAPTRADAMGPAVPPVYVHLVASDRTAIERATDDGWTDVCVAPCDGYVPAFGNYRASVSGKEPSATFTLPGPPGTYVTLKVDDEGRVWTLDSAELASRRAQRATWIGWWGFRPW